MKRNLMKRATSITNKFSDTFSRLTTAATPSISIHFQQDLSHLNQFHFPIPFFRKVCFLFQLKKKDFVFFFKIHEE
jgi:hypothetical protein